MKEIQAKYSRYLENEFDGLNEKQIEEVREIIEIGSRIDLWQIELPDRIKKEGEGRESRGFSKANVGPFELVGLLQEFVKTENEVNEIVNATTVDKFINLLKQLQSIGVDVSKIQNKDTIETLAKKSGISKEKIEKIGLDSTKRIGFQKSDIIKAYRGKGDLRRPTEEQVEELIKLGIVMEKQNPVQEFIDILKQLQSIGVDVSKIVTKDTIETLAKKSGISKGKIEKQGLELKRKIGSQRDRIVFAYRKNENNRLTKKQVKELTKLGITLEKRDPVQECIDTLKRLKSIGVDVSKMQSRDTIESLAERTGMSIEEIEKQGLEPKMKIGSQRDRIVLAYRGKGDHRRATEEQVEELIKLGIELQRGNTIQKFIDMLKQLQSIGVDVSKIHDRDTIETLAKRSGINTEKIKGKGLNPNHNIGNQKSTIIKAYRGKGTNNPPTIEQEEELIQLGIRLEKQEINTVQKFINTLEQLQSIGVDVSIIVRGDTIETLAKKSGINREEIEKLGLDPKKRIGSQKHSISNAYNGRGTNKAPTEEEVKRLLELGINLEIRKRTSKEIAEASISSLTDIAMSDREDEALKKLVEKTKEGGIIENE